MKFLLDIGIWGELVYSAPTLTTYLETKLNSKTSFMVLLAQWWIPQCMHHKTGFVLKRDSVTRFFSSGFFHESPFPKPLKKKFRSFKIFSKIRWDIRESRCTNGVNDTGVNDTGGKFATGINNTRGKFCHQFRLCCWHRRQRYRQQICRRCQRRWWQLATGIKKDYGTERYYRC